MVSLWLGEGDKKQYFDSLILPAADFLPEKAVDIIKEFHTCGGHVKIINSTKIKSSEKLKDTGLFRHLGLEGFFGKNGIINGDKNASLMICDKFDKSEEITYMAKGIKNTFRNYKRGEFTDMLALICDSAGRKEPYAAGRGIISALRKADKNEYLIVANDSDSRTCATVTCKKDAAVFDASTGKRKPAKRNSKGQIEIELYEYESVVIATGEGVDESLIEPEALPEKFIELNGDYEFVIEGNYLVPKCINEDIENSLQLGEKYTAEYVFNINDIPPRIFLITENQNAAWELNENQLDKYDKVRMWTKDNGICDISHYVKKGINILTANAQWPTYKADHKVPFAVIKGDFLVENETIIKKGNYIRPLPWDKQGYPYYSGEAVYKTEFTLPVNVKKAILCFRTANCAVVSINSKDAGQYIWDPYMADITDFCTQGTNMMEMKITNSFYNLFEQDAITSGLNGAPRIYYELEE